MEKREIYESTRRLSNEDLVEITLIIFQAVPLSKTHTHTHEASVQKEFEHVCPDHSQKVTKDFSWLIVSREAGRLASCNVGLLR